MLLCCESGECTSDAGTLTGVASAIECGFDGAVSKTGDDDAAPGFGFGAVIEKLGGANVNARGTVFRGVNAVEFSEVLKCELFSGFLFHGNESCVKVFECACKGDAIAASNGFRFTSDLVSGFEEV